MLPHRFIGVFFVSVYFFRLVFRVFSIMKVYLYRWLYWEGFLPVCLYGYFRSFCLKFTPSPISVDYLFTVVFCLVLGCKADTSWSIICLLLSMGYVVVPFWSYFFLTGFTPFFVVGNYDSSLCLPLLFLYWPSLYYISLLWIWSLSICSMYYRVFNDCI